MEDFPSNAKNTGGKNEEPRKPRVESVLSKGEVTERKVPLFQRFLRGTVSEGRNIWMNVAYGVLLPAAKDMVANAGNEVIERSLFGEARGRPRSGRGSYGQQSYGSSYSYRTPYNSYSGPAGARPDPREQRRDNMDRYNRSNHEFRDLMIPTHVQAMEVIAQLQWLVNEYGQATVADFYDLMGRTGTFADEKYGWVDLSQLRAERVAGEYALNLPRPVPL